MFFYMALYFSKTRQKDVDSAIFRMDEINIDVRETVLRKRPVNVKLFYVIDNADIF